MILIVEDEEQLARIYARVLETHGFTVAVALRGDEGLRLLRENQVGLVLVDLMLPDMNGADFMDCARATGYAGPAVAITGYREALDGLPLAQFVREVQKPLRLPELLKIVRQVLELPDEEETAYGTC